MRVWIFQFPHLAMVIVLFDAFTLSGEKGKIVADQDDPRLQTFLFCSKRRLLRRSKNQRQNVKRPHATRDEVGHTRSSRGSFSWVLYGEGCCKHSSQNRT
eukprot:TRINITY_DN20808_c0_g2_i1.p1 TRINITY_DN20808_c0_g2~~TRINITY_DN20808_c0_g2_i1.p1  ORF type:complete len:100 (+),score=6.54 TRINITY_DN20808_c0_g2_i1:175-474(+)